MPSASKLDGWLTKPVSGKRKRTSVDYNAGNDSEKENDIGPDPTRRKKQIKASVKMPGRTGGSGDKEAKENSSMTPSEQSKSASTSWTRKSKR